MKVNDFYKLRMNKSEIKLLFLLLIWEFWTVDYLQKGIHFHEISVYIPICNIMRDNLIRYDSLFQYKDYILIKDRDIYFGNKFFIRIIELEKIQSH